MLSLLALALSSGDWPQFRGPAGNGVVPAAAIPLHWSESENVAWRIDVPGYGWSQPVVVGDTLYVTTAVGGPTPLAHQAGIDAPDMSKDPVPATEIEWLVCAYDLANGAQRWTASACKGPAKFQIHPSNTHASETPAADARGVYAYFGSTGTVVALDRAGKQRWKVELGAYPTEDAFGTGSSPVLFEERLFVQCFNEERSFLVALDAETGKELWRAERGKGTSWNTPVLWRTQARTELVASGKKHMASHDPASGSVLWSLEGLETPNSSSVTSAGERLYFGLTRKGGAPLYALAAGQSGSLAPKSGESALVGQVWQGTGYPPGIPSPVCVGGQIYALAGGFLSCFDAASGAQRFKERLEGLGATLASPVAVGERLVIVGETGKGVVLAIGPRFEVVGGGELGDMLWATPAIAGDALLLRGLAHLYCLRATGTGG